MSNGIFTDRVLATILIHVSHSPLTSAITRIDH